MYAWTKSLSAVLLFFCFLKTGKKNSRCGWTVPRKVGNAVTRNKIKRWCRELIRQSKLKSIGVSVDVNIVFFAQEANFYKNLDFKQFSLSIHDGWEKLLPQVEKSF